MTHFVAINKQGVKRRGRLGAEIGGGGEGTVYVGALNSSLVVKIYKANSGQIQEKVEAMVQLPPRGQIVDGSAGIVQIAWPQESVFDDSGQFLGYTMPAVDIANTTSLNHLGTPKSRMRNGLRDDYQFRVYVASNISSIVDHIHNAGHWLIDMKPDNMRLYPDTGQVCVIDTDGFNVKGRGRRFPPNVVTPGYLCPEAKSGSGKGKAVSDLDEYQDRFALAVMLFRQLANVHPSMGGARDSAVPPDEQGRIDEHLFYVDAGGRLDEPPTSIFAYLEDETQDLFRKAFLGSPQDRPSAADWHDHILDLISSSRLQVCRKSAEHFKFSKHCPWCKQEAALQKVVAGQSRRAASRATRRQIVAPARPVSAPRRVATTRRSRSTAGRIATGGQRQHAGVTAPGRAGGLLSSVAAVIGGLVGFGAGAAAAWFLFALAGEYLFNLSPTSDFTFGIVTFIAVGLGAMYGMAAGIKFARRKPAYPILIGVGSLVWFLIANEVVRVPDLGVETVSTVSDPQQQQQLVQEIQKELEERGYEPGEIDGIFGSRTSAAIRRFQSDHGLTQNGEVSQGLLVSLRSNPQTRRRSADLDENPRYVEFSDMFGTVPPGSRTAHFVGQITSVSGASLEPLRTGDTVALGYVFEPETLDQSFEANNGIYQGSGAPHSIVIARMDEALRWQFINCPDCRIQTIVGSHQVSVQGSNGKGGSSLGGRTPYYLGISFNGDYTFLKDDSLPAGELGAVREALVTVLFEEEGGGNYLQAHVRVNPLPDAEGGNPVSQTAAAAVYQGARPRDLLGPQGKFVGVREGPLGVMDDGLIVSVRGQSPSRYNLQVPVLPQGPEISIAVFPEGAGFDEYSVQVFGGFGSFGSSRLEKRVTESGHEYFGFSIQIDKLIEYRQQNGKRSMPRQQYAIQGFSLSGCKRYEGGTNCTYPVSSIDAVYVGG